MHSRRLNAARRKIVPHRLGAPRPKGDVVLASAAFIRMTFDGESITIIGGKPLRLLIEGGARLAAQIGRIRIKKDPISHIHDKVLLAPRGSSATANSGPKF